MSNLGDDVSEATENKGEGQDEEQTSDVTDSADAAVEGPATPPTIVRNGGTGTFFLGGLIAAGMGFGASFLPQVTPLIGGKTAALEAQIASQSETINGLKAQLAKLAEGPDFSEISQSVSDVEGRLTETIGTVRGEAEALAGQVSGLDERLASVEKRPTGGEFDDAAVQAYEREVAALREQVEAQSADITGMASQAAERIATLEAAAKEVSETSAQLRAEADAAREAAEAAAAKSAAQSSLSQVAAALAEGGSYEAALPGLAGLFEVPAALSDYAADGVATQADLLAQFSEKATEGLEASRSAGESGEEVGRVQGFFRKQFNVRSTVALDGTSADAVLSRAEVALKDGDLAAVLTEVEALPDTAKTAMSGWIEALGARQGALAALTELTQQLNEK